MAGDIQRRAQLIDIHRLQIAVVQADECRVVRFRRVIRVNLGRVFAVEQRRFVRLGIKQRQIVGLVRGFMRFGLVGGRRCLRFFRWRRIVEFETLAVADGAQAQQFVVVAFSRQQPFKRGNCSGQIARQVGVAVARRPLRRSEQILHLSRQADDGVVGTAVHIQVIPRCIKDVGAQGV